jgi:radical SAM-linked protein
MGIVFTKTGWMRYISHLDLMRLFHRAVRRAKLPIALTQGFSPHPKMSIQRALKLGCTSEHEEATFYLSAHVHPGAFQNRLQEQLPEGIEIRSAQLC